MQTVFVTSGKYKTAEEIVPSLAENVKPDTVCKDMQEVLERIKGEEL